MNIYKTFEARRGVYTAERIYSTSSVEGGSDVTVLQIDQIVDIVDVLTSTFREHGTTSRKVKFVPLILNPVLYGLFNSQFLVRHIHIPGILQARGPRKGVFVLWWCRNEAFEKLVLCWAVPFSIYEPVPWKLE